MTAQDALRAAESVREHDKQRFTTKDHARRGRAARAWAAWLNATGVLLLWWYVDPWAALGWSLFLHILALYFGRGEVLNAPRR